MAVSPLRWFRKHSMFFMVVFGIGAMVIFGLGSVVGHLNPNEMNRASTAKEVVATWKGGDINRGQLQGMQARHFQAHRFLQAVYTNAVKQKGGESFRPPVRVVSPIRRDLDEAQFDEQLMNRFLLAEKAKEEGFVVNDQMVYDYIGQIGGNLPMSRNDLRAINRQVNQGGNAALESMVEALKTEILFSQMMVLTGGGMPITPNPTESMQFYDRTHRKITCKMIDYPVADFIEKVSADDAPAGELKALFAEGEYEYPDPSGKKPGFKVGKKVRVKYFTANRETFLENEMNKLTDEEIQAEYEELVEKKDNMVMEVVPEEKEEDGPALIDPNSDAGEATEDSADADEGAAEESGDEAPAPPAAEEGAVEEVPLEAPAEEAPAEETPAEEGEGGGLTKLVDKIDRQFVSIQEEEATPVQEGLPLEEAPVEGVPLEGKPLEGETLEGVPVPKEPILEGGPAPAETQATADAPAPKTGAESQDPEFQTAPEIKRRPKPLKDVQDQIKRSMKAAAAADAMAEAIKGAENKLRLHQMMHGRWSSRPIDNDEEEPAEPDYKAIADEFGLEFNETPLVDRRTMADEELGKIVSFEFGQGQRPTQYNVGDRILDTYYDTTLFSPEQVEDFRSGKTYLYFVTEKVDQKILTYADALPAVKEFWKNKKGLELARAAAQADADKVNEGTNLVMIGLESTLDSGEFSWFSNLGQFNYGSPNGVENAGDEFMETAFGLEMRKAGVAANSSLDHVYAIQLIKKSDQTAEMIGDEYLSDQFFKFKRQPADVSSISQVYISKLNQKWLENFVSDMDLKWVSR